MKVNSGESSAIKSGIAVVGMACRVPGAASVAEFWRNLRGGVESVRRLTPEELLAAGVKQAELENPALVPVAAIIDGMEMFDAEFFGIPARDAEVMDPQHRIFLETAWSALEDAGYDPDRFPGAISVFGGGVFGSYASANLIPSGVFDAGGPVLQAVLANEKDYMTTRVSYKLNLRGPCYTVQSGCSTSLVAVHLACQNLLNFESDLALAGGVAIDVLRGRGYHFQEGSVYSKSGRCRPFDAEADGTVFGNGVGIVALKRLDEALEDGDRIYAVVLGSATNNDGSRKVGFTAPSVTGQQNVIAEALSDAGVSADTIGYVEAHGTGTALGDPIEIEAMSKAFAPAARIGTCALGSVKANIGHLDAAAGVIGFIKAALSLHDSVLVPAPNFEQPNPKIELGRTPFYVNRKLQPWSSGTRPGVPRRAGVSSFGMGGTNAHVILQEAPAAANVPSPRSAQLIVLSARTEQALEDSTRQLAEHLQERPELDLADVAHTLQMGRGVFAHRRTVVGRTAGDVAQALGTLDPARVRTSAYDGATSHVAFMFPGQGAQYAGMCAGIYRAFPVFAEAFDECCAQLRAHLDRDLRNIVFAPESEREQSSLVLQRTEYAQPVLFAIEYSLARLWMSWGVTPAACIGHSVGEYVAACIGGVLPFRDAIRIVAGRGRLMQELPEGAMTAVFLPAHELAEWLVPPLELAALNGPRVAVVAGPLEAMASFERRCAERTIETRRLRTSHAFHSAAMEPILAKFLDLFNGVNLSAPKVPFVSNLTGTWITAAEARSPRYWAAHLRQPVRFSEGVRALAQKDNPVLLEVGPGRTLSSLAIQNVPPSTTLASVPQSGEETSDVEQLLDTAGHLWRRGRAIDWSRFSEGESRRRVSLPTYPFQRQRYWLEPSPVEEPKPVVEGIEEKFAEIGRWFYLPEWRQTPPPHFYAGGRVEAADSTWLLFVEPTEFCGAVVQRLETLADPARMFVVSAGDRFEQSGARQFTINPRRREDYLSLVRALDGVGALPHVVAHLWATARLADGDVVEAQYRGFYSLTFLTQALRNVAGDALRPTRIQIVGRGMFDVAGSEQLEPGKVTAVAACRVLSREQSELTCRAIDVDATDANAVRTVVDELRLQAPDSMIAYRGGRRWTPLIESIGLPQEVGNAAPLREKGCYLIAGGFGAIGSVLARHLAQTVGAKLVLLSRVPVPEGDARSRWLDTHTEHDATSARIRFVRDLERMGADVLVAVADVADIDAMNAARDAAIARFGEINGVVFAAGMAGAGAVQAPDAARSGSVLAPVAEITESSANAQFRPKLQGLPLLEQVLGDRPLDFCLIVSSLSSVIPGPGYATYAAANAFMDAFVHHHNQRSAVRWLAVNWDAWSFGAAAETALGRVTITEAEGVDVFRRVLGAAGLGHIIVSTLNLHARAASAAKPAEAAAPERKLYSRPESLQASFEAPLTPVEETVTQVWQQVLGIDRVGRRDNFFQLGGHSLLAVQVVARLEDILHVEVPMRHVFDAATVSDLAARIEAALMGASVYSARLNDETADVEELEI